MQSLVTINALVGYTLSSAPYRLDVRVFDLF
jgi:hypothetical protein